MPGLARSMLATLGCACALAGCADPGLAHHAVDPSHRLVDDASASLASFAPEDFPSLSPALRGACAALLFPHVGAASFGLGAAHGHGVLMVRDAAQGQWHGPAFVSLSELDAGIQVALGSWELVVVLDSCEPLAPLLAHSSSLRAGAWLADQAGERGDASVPARGVHVFSRLHGADVGGALQGTLLVVDDHLAADFYGAPTTLAGILARDAAGDGSTVALRRELARSAR